MLRCTLCSFARRASARLVLHTSCCTSATRSASQLRVCFACSRTDPGHSPYCLFRQLGLASRAKHPLRMVCTSYNTSLTRSASVWCTLRVAPARSLRERPLPLRVSRVLLRYGVVCQPFSLPLLPSPRVLPCVGRGVWQAPPPPTNFFMHPPPTEDPLLNPFLLSENLPCKYSTLLSGAPMPIA